MSHEDLGALVRASLKDAWIGREVTLPYSNKLLSGTRAPRVPGTTTNQTAIRPVPVFNSTYVPRELFGVQDIALGHAARAAKQHMLLSGPPGTGKTAYLAAAFPEAIKIACHPEMDASALLGEWIKDGAKWKFLDGPLVTAMRQGLPFFIDEVGKAPLAVQNVLLSAMDGSADSDNPAAKPLQIGNPSDPGVYAQPGFFVISAWNPGLRGAHIDDAVVSRCGWTIEILTDWDVARTLLVPDAIIAFSKRVQAGIEQGSITSLPWGPQLRDALFMRDLSIMIGEQHAAEVWLTKAAQIAGDSPAAVVTEVGAVINAVWAGPTPAPARLGGAWTGEPTQVETTSVEGL